jgi:hypothetical protein
MVQLQKKNVTFSKKTKNSKFHPDRKILFRKNILSINVLKISQIGDGHWSLYRFLQKTALKLWGNSDNFKFPIYTTQGLH